MINIYTESSYIIDTHVPYTVGKEEFVTLMQNNLDHSEEVRGWYQYYIVENKYIKQGYDYIPKRDMELFIISMEDWIKQVKMEHLKDCNLNNPKFYWCVKHDDSQDFKDIVLNYLSKYIKWGGNSVNTYYGYDGSSVYGGSNQYNDINNFYNNPKLLTIEEFKYLLEKSKQTESMKDNEEIVGYKIKSQYERFALAMLNTISKEFEINSSLYKQYKQAGVLDLWCEPFYKSEIKSQECKIGNGIVTVYSDGRIVGEKEYTIRNWELLYDHFAQTVSLMDKFNTKAYSCNTESVKIGCRSLVTLEQIEELISQYYILNPKS